MIKGVNKNIMVVNDTGSTIFEQAIFILKPGKNIPSQGDMAREAQRVINNKVAQYAPKPRKKKILNKLFDSLQKKKNRPR